MKNRKGVSLINVVIIVIVIIIAICLISKINETKQRQIIINEYNDSASDYNLDMLKKNKIILKYYPTISSDYLFKEISRIPLDTANSKNYSYLMETYTSERQAVVEYNDALLEYYRTILNEN